jgi:hypothetical protein
MRKRRLVFSDAAIADIVEQAEWYAAQSGRPLARRRGESSYRSRLARSQPSGRRHAVHFSIAGTPRLATYNDLRVFQASALLPVR